MRKITIGVDAVNIKSGGGVNHLLNILLQFDSEKHPNIQHIIVWGGKKVLDVLPDSPIISKKSHHLLHPSSLIKEAFWKYFYMQKELLQCDILGSTIG